MDNRAVSAVLLWAAASSLGITGDKPAAAPARVAYGVCMHMVEEGAPEGFVYVNVLIHAHLSIPHVLIPIPAHTGIVKIELPSEGKPARFVEVAATLQQRIAPDSACRWVDGSVMEMKGGVQCNGWSYKSLLAPSK